MPRQSRLTPARALLAGRVLALCILSSVSSPATTSAFHNEKYPAQMLADAELTDVCFVDARHGWAVGDRGVIWSSDDGGKHWQRQVSGVSCRLQSVFFLNSQLGWAVGGQASPYLHRSHAVVLRTVDGGRHWTRQKTDTMPALKRVKFFDQRRGWAIGNASTMYPAGVFQTNDGGRSWTPLPAGNKSGWLAGDFPSPSVALIAGRDGALARVDGNRLQASRTPGLGLRHLHSIRLTGPSDGWLAGDGALLLQTRDGGVSWQLPSGKLPAGTIGQFDFHALAVRGDHIWVAGSPGTAVFHSADGGRHWRLLSTGQSLPILGLTFVDQDHGWAVGALGTILVTADGGITWHKQRGGGERAALLGFFAEAKHVPLEMFVRICGNEGYLGAVEVLNRRDVETPGNPDAPLPQRTQQALIDCGASSAHSAWQFPLRQSGLQLSAESILDGWNRTHDGRGAASLEEHVVSKIRQWRPEIVVTQGASLRGGNPLAHLTNQIVLQAVEKAADPTAYSEQITLARLKPWTVKKVFGLANNQQTGVVRVVTSQLAANLGRSLADQAAVGHGLINDQRQPVPPTIEFQLLSNRLPVEVSRRDFFSGLSLRPGGDARRMTPRASVGNLESLRRLAQRHRNVQQLLDRSVEDPLGGTGWLGQIDDLTRDLPARSAGDVLDRLARRYHRYGKSTLAAETLDLLIHRYPEHALSDAALFWLMQYYASGEEAWRQQKGTKLEYGAGVGQVVKTPPLRPMKSAKEAAHQAAAQRRNQQQKQNTTLPSRGLQRKEPIGAEIITGGRRSTAAGDGMEGIDRARRAAALGKMIQRTRPEIFAEPALRFSLSSAHRKAGLVREAERFYHQVSDTRSQSTWAANASSELWLAHGAGIPPKTTYQCITTASKPKLDGKFDEGFWQRAKTINLTSPQRDDEKWPAQVRLAYDRQYLYFAVRCVKAPNVKYAASDQPRPRDPDLTQHDRVDLLIDLDRDYASYYRLTIDHRGWLSESCFGDANWNPQWYAAAHADEKSWTVEGAIPLSELSAQPPSSRDAWAVGLQRTVPSVGFQAWTRPAAVDIQPEGFGLLIFE